MKTKSGAHISNKNLIQIDSQRGVKLPAVPAGPASV
jgi:hypothetical protein